MTALRGVRVLELAETVAGEYCGKLLSDFGAEIIKIEKPGIGSPTRQMGPFRTDPNTNNDTSGLFAYLNTGKQSIELDITSPQQSEKVKALINQADVIIDDHDITLLRDLEIDANSIQKHSCKTIVCSITPFGLEPPAHRTHGEDLTVFHSSGWGYHTPTGANPAHAPLNGAGRFLPSYEAAIEGALCVSAALFDCVDSGAGRFIEISKQEVLASRTDYVLAQMVAGEMNVSTCRTAYDLGGPAGIFPCQDGFVYIWLSAPAHWIGLRELLDDTQWMDDFPDNWLEKECTPERVATCRKHIEQWLQTQNKQSASEKAQKLGVTLVAVNNAQDLVESPQYQYRKFFVPLQHPTLGNALYPTVPYHLSLTPARSTIAAPLLGQNNPNNTYKIHSTTDKEQAL